MSNFVDLQKQFAAHLRNPFVNEAPEGIEDRRLQVYRGLFFRNMNALLGYNFPVLKKLYGTEKWERLVRDFYTRHQSHAPLFPELPREFVQFLEHGRGANPDDPPFLVELAHYEWVELALAYDATDLDEAAAAVDPDGDLLEGVPAPSPLAWRFSYRFPVHRIRPDFQPTEPPAEMTHLVVYRTRNDEVCFMVLNAVAARLLEMIQTRDRSGREHLAAVAAELGAGHSESVQQHGLTLLSQLRGREVLLGTKREDSR